MAFAPKALRLATDLSERLGYGAVRTSSRSRPAGLSRGARTISESDQRRALMLPQELTQLGADRLIVLKAGSPPVLGRKIAYYREPAFHDRVRPPPDVPCLALRASETPTGPAAAPDALTLAAITPMLAAEGFEPVPPAGASAEAVEAWVERFIDAAAGRQQEDRDASGR